MAEDLGPLRRLVLETGQSERLSMKDLTVLDPQNDPFRIDTPAGHRDGMWLATHVDRLARPFTKIHLRGLHYVLTTHAPVKPNGETYRNTDKDWNWLQDKAADAARWLGYIPFERIVDHRNSAPEVRVFTEPQPTPYLSTSVHVDIPDMDDIEPVVYLDGFSGVQPYKLVVIGEKSSLADVLGPVAAFYKADLYLPTGELSDTQIHHMAKVGKADGRPMVVLYFADCDPAGWQMGISVARKLQAFQVLDVGPSQWELHRVALTPDQVRRYGLPSTPLKESERRADRWREGMGVEQTEIDALAALRPDLLRRIADEAIAPFHDHTLDLRVEQAQTQWEREAQAVVDARIDAEFLDEIRGQAQARLGELRDEIDAINAALRIDIAESDLPPIEVPQANPDGGGGLPLVDSRWSFAEQTRRLKQSKVYAPVGGG